VLAKKTEELVEMRPAATGAALVVLVVSLLEYGFYFAEGNLLVNVELDISYVLAGVLVAAGLAAVGSVAYLIT